MRFDPRHPFKVAVKGRGQLSLISLRTDLLTISARALQLICARVMEPQNIFVCDNGDRKTRKTISQRSTRNEEGEEKVAELWDQS